MCGSWEYRNCLLHINAILSEALTLQQQQHEGWSVQSCQEYLSSLGTNIQYQILFSTSTRWWQAVTAIKTYNHTLNIVYSFKNYSGGWNKFNFFHNETICLNHWLWRWCPKLCVTTVLHNVNAFTSNELNKNTKIMVAISFSLGKSPLNTLFASSPPNILHVDIQQKNDQIGLRILLILDGSV